MSSSNQRMKLISPIKHFRAIGALWLILSGFISYVLSTTVDMSGYELGALVNYFLPPVLGVFTILVFLILSFVIRNLTYLKVLLVVLCLYNVYVGFALHFEKEGWPLVLF